MEAAVEYGDREGADKDWKPVVLGVLVAAALSVCGYFWLTLNSHSERLVKLETQKVTPEGLSTESGTLRKDFDGKIDQVSKKVDNLRTEVKTDIGNLRAEVKTDIDNLRTEVKADIDNLRTEVKTDIGNLRTELKTDIKDLRSEMNSGFQNVNSKIADINKILLERLPPKKK